MIVFVFASSQKHTFPEGKVEFLEHMEACLHRIQDYRCMRLKSHEDFRVGMVEFLEDLEDYVVIRKNSGRIWRSSGPKQLTIIRIVGAAFGRPPQCLVWRTWILPWISFMASVTPIEVTPLVVFYWGVFSGFLRKGEGEGSREKPRKGQGA